MQSSRNEKTIVSATAGQLIGRLDAMKGSLSKEQIFQLAGILSDCINAARSDDKFIVDSVSARHIQGNLEVDFRKERLAALDRAVVIENSILDLLKAQHPEEKATTLKGARRTWKIPGVYFQEKSWEFSADRSVEKPKYIGKALGFSQA